MSNSDAAKVTTPEGGAAQIHEFSETMEPLGQIVLSIGAFDGVHTGHRALIDDMIVDASFRGVPSVVITFDPDPDEVIPSITPAPKLMTHKQRIETLACTGVDHVVVVPFSEKVASLSPKAFLNEVILAIGQPRAIHVGEDFRFGHKAQGTINELCVWGYEHQCQILGYPLFGVSGRIATATKIRALLEEGRVTEASDLLGYPYGIGGEVVHGRGEGRKLNFPTVNIEISAGLVCPKDGVYAGRAVIEPVHETGPIPKATCRVAPEAKPESAVCKAAIHVGPAPTYGVDTRTIEAHLLGISEDLYGKNVRLEFIDWIASLKAYKSLDELKDALQSFTDETNARISL